MKSYLSLTNISFSYKDKVIFSNVNYNFDSGKIYTIMGHNGVGKTTLLNIIYGNLILDSGTISLNQQDISRPLDEKDLFFLPTIPLLPEFLTGREFITFYAKENFADLDKLDIYLNQVSFIEPDLDKLIETYSTGMKNKILIICALLSKNKIILLDEPLVSLDFIVASEVKTILKSLKKDHIIIFSTHILEIANDLADEIVLISGNNLHTIKNENTNTNELDNMIRIKFCEEE